MKKRISIWAFGERPWEECFKIASDAGFDGIEIDISERGVISSLGGYYNELRYFIDRLIDGKEIEVAPLGEAIKSTKLVLKAIETAGPLVR